MAKKRSQAAQDEAFARGEVGVDGEATDEALEPEQAERMNVLEELVRNRTYLGRELLTWLLWRSSSGDVLGTVDGEPLKVLFVGGLTLRGLAGEATELAAKGVMAPYAPIVRQAIAGGLLVHSARLRLQHGERFYEATVDAEHLSVRSARLPDLVQEEAEDRLLERLEHAERLSALLEHLLQDFLKLRASRKWRERVVPELRAYLTE